MQTKLVSTDPAVLISIKREADAANLSATKRGIAPLTVVESVEGLTIDGDGPLMADLAEAVEWAGKAGSLDWWPLREYLVLACLVVDKIGLVPDVNAAMMKWSVNDEPQRVHLNCADIILALAGHDSRFQLVVDKGIVTERTKGVVQKMMEEYKVSRETLPKEG
jgi:hypothetical protein